jgi:LDH2 family malate/lactate/ureidoglycolate dehydrogenase
LAGGPIFGNGVGLPGQLDREMGVSLFLLAIDPAAAMEFSAFTGRVETFVDDLRGSAAPTDSAPVRLPGERSQALAQACQEHGIPIPDDVVASITAVGLELGVLPPLP